MTNKLYKETKHLTLHTEIVAPMPELYENMDTSNNNNNETGKTSASKISPTATHNIVHNPKLNKSDKLIFYGPQLSFHPTNQLYYFTSL